ncbi:hypothetical protein VER_02550 [Veillonella sp. R32]|nr:hypothetical protein VER_02550 [Veillonella sp. R32]
MIMNCFFNKYSIIILVFLLDIFRMYFFQNQIIPTLLLIVLGAILCVIYTIDSKYILRKFDFELFIYMLFSIILYKLLGQGSLAIAVFVFWFIFNTACAVITSYNRQKMFFKSEHIIEDELNHIQNTVDIVSVENKLRNELEAIYRKDIEALRSKYEKSKNNKKKYEKLIQSINEEKDEQLLKASQALQALSKENETLRDINFVLVEENQELQNTLADLRNSYDSTIKKIENQKIKDDKETQILKNEKIRDAFKNGLNSAQSEICIISPWVGHRVIKNYAKEFQSLARKGVRVKLIYGIGVDKQVVDVNDSNYNRLVKSRNAVKYLKSFYTKEKKANLISTEERHTHAKLFIVDDNWYLLGSMNLLSFDYSDSDDKREELAEKIYNSKKIQLYKKEYFSF